MLKKCLEKAKTMPSNKNTLGDMLSEAEQAEAKDPTQLAVRYLQESNNAKQGATVCNSIAPARPECVRFLRTAGHVWKQM